MTVPFFSGFYRKYPQKKKKYTSSTYHLPKATSFVPQA